MLSLFRTRRARPCRRDCGLRVEALEDRQLLSAVSRLHPSDDESVSLRERAPAAEVAESDRSRTKFARAARVAPKTPLLPDLTVWADERAGYMHDWRIDRDEPLMPGRTLLRLTNAIANIGAGPLEIRGGEVLPDGRQEVFQRIYHRRSEFTERLAGTFVFHEHHSHVHFDDFAQYNLRAVTEDNGVGPVVAVGGKVSFCLLDVEAYDTSLPRAPRSSQYDSCHDSQGISVGWADVYSSSLADQWIDVTDLPETQYWLESVVDPSNLIVESDETNNATRILISLGPPPADDFDNELSGARELTLTNGIATQAGRIETPRDVDVFSFISPRKGRVTVTQQASSGGLDSYLRVYGPSEQLIAENDDFQHKLDSRVRFKAAAGSRYFVKAGGFSDGTGTYLITVSMGARH